MRYFIVFFRGSFNGEDIDGDLPGTTKGEYIERKKTCTAIEKAFDCTDVTIINILELSEEDYKTYNK